MILSAKQVGWAGWLIVGILSAWLIWPAFFPVHVEGFSASIVALGTHFAEGSMADFLPSQPFNTEYFTLTKLGAVMGVAGLVHAFGIDGTVAIRLLMWGGLLLLLAGSAVLMKRWASTSWLVVCASLALMPGVFESAFFFNDNVPAAGVMSVALALFRPARGVLGSVFCGLLMGVAVAARIDLVVLCAAIPLIALAEQEPRAAAATTAIVAAVTIATIFLVFAIAGSTPFDALHVGAIAVELWARPAGLANQLALLITFAGLAGLILLLLGASTLFRQGAWLRVALLVGIPLLLNLILVGKMWEVRQLLALTPFFGALVAIGINRLAIDFREGQRLLPVVVGLTELVCLFAPASQIYVKDGPRESFGRIEGIGLWRAWQQSVENDMSRIGGVVAAAQPNTTLAIIADQWDEDRYAHLELLQHGYRSVASTPLCSKVASTMQRGNRRIVHITLQQTFVSYWEAIQADRLQNLVLPCLNAERPGATVLLVGEVRAGFMFNQAVMRKLGAASADPRLFAAGYTPILAIPLDADRLVRVEQVYRENDPTRGNRFSITQGMATTAPRTNLLR
jgi:hypothetical protein